MQVNPLCSLPLLKEFGNFEIGILIVFTVFTLLMRFYHLPKIYEITLFVIHLIIFYKPLIEILVVYVGPVVKLDVFG
jgi:hypothetical protein